MKAILRSVFLAMVIMALAVPVDAGPLEDGSAAYQHGDYATALQLWRPLAEQGDAWGQAFLGSLYAGGLGVPQDYAVAAQLFSKAAKQGNLVGQYEFGVMHQFGRGVRQDSAEAMKWWQLAAEQSHPGAQYNLGLMYWKGLAVPKDYVLAYMWFNLSAAQVSLMNVDDARTNRDNLAKHMTPDQIDNAQRMAREWMEKHQR